MGIYELLGSSDDIRELVTRRAATNEIKSIARQNGLTTLREDGWDKVLSGATSVDEVLRVTKAD